MVISMAQKTVVWHAIPKRSWPRSINILLMICSIVLRGTRNVELLERSDHHEPSTLIQICQKSSLSRSRISIFTPLQMSQLIGTDQDQQIEKACDAKYWPAIKELRALLAPERMRDICSIQMYELIQAYHTRFIHYYLPERTREQLLEQRRLFKKNETLIPAPLRTFFILFVKQITATCKQNLVVHFKDKLSALDEDISMVDKFKHDVHQLSHRLRWLSDLRLSSFDTKHKANKFNELQIVNSMGAYRKKSDPRVKIKLHVGVNHDSPLYSIKLACEFRFKPVYKELFAPVIRLNNLGYIERTWSRLEDKKLNKDRSLLRWYKIIRVCDAFENIEVQYNPKSSPTFVLTQDNLRMRSGEGIYGILIRLLSEVEILSQNETLHKSAEMSTRIYSSYNPEPLCPTHVPVAFVSLTSMCKRQKIERELQDFRKDLSRLVWRRTSRLSGWREKIRQQLRFIRFALEELRKPSLASQRESRKLYVNLIIFMVLTIALVMVGSGLIALANIG